MRIISNCFIPRRKTGKNYRQEMILDVETLMLGSYKKDDELIKDAVRYVSTQLFLRKMTTRCISPICIVKQIDRDSSLSLYRINYTLLVERLE